ncbi:putative transport protein [Phyllobacterium sp. CL33Tsu]|uniref:aspartate-alanine antiporter n=1 Tax=Phyllobacterium TaxID=28100 RepID=UPI0008E54E44|nr:MULTISPECIES: aspartate-alanine antiporter [unclassified Phyllobacterium]UGY11470.1 aspartate-alanine antiporter [Phyllobacterium sp. T1018]SFJ21728.1 putative transport protein [Phyllobacterium sp. CL33Tsu]
MTFFVQALRDNPELAIFLALAIGFLIGRVKLGSFSLGIVVGTLLAGVLIGQLDIKIPPIVKVIFFDLFLFTTGYKVGPQFFRGLKQDAIPQVALTLVLCVACLLTAFGFATLLGYDVGTAAGLLAGAFSESTVIGTAGEAIQRLAIPEAERVSLLNNIPVAYAVTYLIGTASLVWFLPTIGPKLMGVNLRDEGMRMQGTALVGSAQLELGVTSGARLFDLRAYRVTNPKLVNKTVAELEALPQGSRVFIARIRHHGGIVEALPNSVIREGDVVAVLARQEIHVNSGKIVGPEVDDKPLLDLPVEVLDVVVTRGLAVGKTLGELAQLEFTRSVFLRKLTRAGQEMPVTAKTTIDGGDVLSLIGTKPEVERAAKELGYPDRPTMATDMVFVGTGIVLGGLVGLLSVTVGGIPLTLTASGGALIMGLVFGWLRSVHPFFGRIPEPAIWIFDTVGLCIFIGVVGINAGPSFFSGLQQTGLSLVMVGLVSALLPHTIAILFGRYMLKMNPLIVLGACAGAGTITAALRAIQDESRSSIPALGYTVPYAIGNILLTAWGPVLVALMTIGE